MKTKVKMQSDVKKFIPGTIEIKLESEEEVHCLLDRLNMNHQRIPQMNSVFVSELRDRLVCVDIIEQLEYILESQ